MTTSIPTKKTRRRRCSECGKLKLADDVLGRQRICEKCEEDMHYCRVCDEWQHDDTCRHLGWSSAHGCEAGCGTWDIDAEAHKDSFMLLLDKIAPIAWDQYFDANERYVRRPAMPKVLACIEANNFWTLWHGPMIGGPPDLSFLCGNGGDGDKFWAFTICDIRASDQLKWGDVSELQLGMAWLTSIDDKSIEANKITAAWIREWMARPPGQATRDAADARKRELLIRYLGTLPKPMHKAIFKSLNVPGKNRKELEAVPLDKLRDVAKHFHRTAISEGARS